MSVAASESATTRRGRKETDRRHYIRIVVGARPARDRRMQLDRFARKILAI